MKNNPLTNHLFVRPADLERGAFHIDALREYEQAGDYTEEFRRVSSLWHEASEQPSAEYSELLIWHEGCHHPWITCVGYDPDFDWARYCEVFSVYRWAYVEDFLPFSATIHTDE